jgi:hypothetical protein
MPLTAETQSNIIELCKQGKYLDAAELLVGETKEAHSYEEVVEAMIKVAHKCKPRSHRKYL